MFKSILKKLHEYYATVMDCTLLLTGVFGGSAIMAFILNKVELGVFALLMEIGMLELYVAEVKYRLNTKEPKSSEDEAKTNDEVSSECAVAPQTLALPPSAKTNDEIRPERAVAKDKVDYTHAYDKYAGLYEHLDINDLNAAIRELEETYSLLASILDSDHYYRIENGITMAVSNAGYSRFSVAYVTNGKLHADYWEAKPEMEAHLLDVELDKVFESVLDEARINLRVMQTILLSKIKASVKLAEFHDEPAIVNIKPIANELPEDDSVTYTTVQVVSYPYVTFMRSE